jgi:hypothetical protein
MVDRSFIGLETPEMPIAVDAEVVLARHAALRISQRSDRAK